MELKLLKIFGNIDLLPFKSHLYGIEINYLIF